MLHSACHTFLSAQKVAKYRVRPKKHAAKCAAEAQFTETLEFSWSITLKR
jgi:hypothetical protein